MNASRQLGLDQSMFKKWAGGYTPLTAVRELIDDSKFVGALPNARELTAVVTQLMFTCSFSNHMTVSIDRTGCWLIRHIYGPCSN